jgi:hypothetical protein
MATLRYTARFSGSNAEITRPYPCFSDSVEELDRFLEDCKHGYGDKLRWVSIERSEETVLYSDFAEWDELDRRYP